MCWDRLLLLNTVVQVAYGTDLDRIIPVLRSAMSTVPRVLAEPAPNVFLTAFAADGLELTFSFWIGDPENGQLPVRSAVNMVILATLAEQGIEIPFPQRVLHRASAPAVSSATR